MRWWWWIAVLAAGCASTLAPPREFVHEGPLEVWDLGRMGDDLVWTLGEHVSVGLGASERLLKLPDGERAQVVTLVEIEDVEYLLVGVVDAAGRWSLYRYHDADDDRAVDESTRTLLVSKDANIANMDRTLPWGTFYCLDRRYQEIWRIRDTDGDGFPDRFGLAPVASSRVMPSLLDATMLFALGEYCIDVYAGDQFGAYGHFDHVYRYAHPGRRLTDNDQDGVMDRDEAVLQVGYPGTQVKPFHANDRVIHVAANPAQAITVWRLEVLARHPRRDGDRAELLGHTHPTSWAWTYIELRRPLREGERISVGGVVGDVPPAEPQKE